MWYPSLGITNLESHDSKVFQRFRWKVSLLRPSPHEVFSDQVLLESFETKSSWNPSNVLQLCFVIGSELGTITTIEDENWSPDTSVWNPINFPLHYKYCEGTTLLPGTKILHCCSRQLLPKSGCMHTRRSSHVGALHKRWAPSCAKSNSVQCKWHLFCKFVECKGRIRQAKICLGCQRSFLPISVCPGNISLESGCMHTLMHWKVASDPIQGDLRWRLDHLDQAPVPPLTWDRHLSGKGWKAPVSKQEKVCFRWRHKSSLPYSYFQDGFQIFWMKAEFSWTGRLWSIPIPLDSKREKLLNTFEWRLSKWRDWKNLLADNSLGRECGTSEYECAF